MELTDEQKKIIYAPHDINARIIAVPGSGKTTTLVHRIGYLVNEMQVDPEKILCISFSQNAVNELKNRLAGILNTDRKVDVRTYHSFAFSIIKKHKEKIFKTGDTVSVLLGSDKENVIKGLFNDMFSVQNKEDERKLFSFFVRFIEKRQVYKITDKKSAEREHELIKLNFDFFEQGYKKYNSYLINHNLVDFESMQALALSLLVRNEEVRKEYIDKYDYYFVDEFQDTSWVQSSILLNMLNKSKIVIVGDADQNLYYWRGSDNKFILDFHNNVDVQDYMLSKNFRSTDAIIKSANEIIKKNVNRFDIKIKENDTPSAPISVIEHLDADAESSNIIDKVKMLLASGIEPGKIAVLFNINEVGLYLYNRMIAAGIPSYFFGYIKFTERREIKEIINFLRFMVNPHDDEACARLMREMPGMNIGETTKAALENELKGKGMTLWEGCIDLSQAYLDDTDKYAALKRAKNIAFFTSKVLEIKHKADAGGVYFSRILRAIIESGITRKYKQDKDKRDNIKTLLNSIKSRNIQDPEGLMDFIIDLSCDYGLDADEEKHIKDNAIHFMSIYKAKGLEYKYVFMIGNETGIFPFENQDKNAVLDYEDARRVFYVGLTRAQLGLEVHCATFRPITWRYNKPGEKSLFVKELAALPETVVRFIQNY